MNEHYSCQFDKLLILHSFCKMCCIKSTAETNVFTVIGFSKSFNLKFLLRSTSWIQSHSFSKVLAKENVVWLWNYWTENLCSQWRCIISFNPFSFLNDYVDCLLVNQSLYQYRCSSWMFQPLSGTCPDTSGTSHLRHFHAKWIGWRMWRVPPTLCPMIGP